MEQLSNKVFNSLFITPNSLLTMHLPVLLKEVLEVLNPQPGEFFIDGTLGQGGHAQEIIKKISPNGIFLGIDWDKSALEKFKLLTTHYQLQTIVETANYAAIPEILENHHLPKADGLLLDLGFSSEQIESASWRTGRGFSFRNPPAGGEPLLMTYSNKEKPVSVWLNKLSVKELENIIRNYGEERYAGRIAKAIKSRLPITTSGKLTAIIVSAVPKNYERGRIHPATRTFQALRIFVNRELENLQSILKSIPEIMAANGRVAIISFHSLEDRLVKIAFKKLSQEKKAILLTKKPMVVTPEEIKNNPRSRSAKLRAIILQ